MKSRSLIGWFQQCTDCRLNISQTIHRLHWQIVKIWSSVKHAIQPETDFAGSRYQIRYLSIPTEKTESLYTYTCILCFLPCCSYEGAVFLWASVCLSISPSVCHTCGLWQYETNLCRHCYTIWKVNSSSFPTWRMVGGGSPLVSEILGQTDSTASKMAISNRYSLVAPQHLDLAKKSSVMTNRKSTTSFSMSLRWTVYVAPKLPKGDTKMQIDHFFL